MTVIGSLRCYSCQHSCYMNTLKLWSQNMMGALAAATYAALVPAVADMERAVELRDDRGEDDEEDAAPTPVRLPTPHA